MKWRGLSEKEYPTAALSLREQLLEIRANIAQYALPEKEAIHQRAIEALQKDGIVARALTGGSIAPDFALPDQNARTVDSRELRAAGPLIVLFFRGRWCPFCVTTLEAWRDRMAQVRAAGAQLVAISPMTAKHSSFMAGQHKLPFPLLSDAGNTLAHNFGIAYTVSEEQRALYQSVFINLAHQNGDESWTLPIPATFVIAPEGKLIYSHADPDFHLRSEPEEVLASLK